MDEKPFLCDFLLAYDDYTWGTRTFELPVELKTCKDDELEAWWVKNEGGNSWFGNVVMAKVYSRDVEEEEVEVWEVV